MAARRVAHASEGPASGPPPRDVLSAFAPPGAPSSPTGEPGNEGDDPPPPTREERLAVLWRRAKRHAENVDLATREIRDFFEYDTSKPVCEGSQGIVYFAFPKDVNTSRRIEGQRVVLKVSGSRGKGFRGLARTRTRLFIGQERLHGL